jgi:hypothetical protein
MAKTAKNSTAQKTAPNKETHKFEEFYSLKDFRQRPASDMYKDALASRLMVWADDPENVMITEFYGDEGLLRGTFFRWVETSEALKNAYGYARDKIAARLFKAGLKREFSDTLVFKALPIYSEEFKQLEEWRAKLGEKVDGATQINVYTTAFPNSDKVKPRVPQAPIEDKG